MVGWFLVTFFSCEKCLAWFRSSISFDIFFWYILIYIEANEWQSAIIYQVYTLLSSNAPDTFKDTLNVEQIHTRMVTTKKRSPPLTHTCKPDLFFWLLLFVCVKYIRHFSSRLLSTKTQWFSSRQVISYTRYLCINIF